MVLRTNDGFLWTTVSHDRGETWAAPKRTSMVAAATSHNLFRLQNGLLVLTHNESPASVRTNLTIRISDDEGETWRSPVTLARVSVPGKDEPVWSRQATYPSLAEVEGGTVVVVWAEITVSDQEQYGDIRAAVVKIG